MAQIRLRIQGSFCIGSGGQVDLVDGVLLGLDFVESFLEIIFGVFPFERLGDLVIEGLKLKYGRFKAFKVWEVVWRQDLALQHGEEYLNLVEPTGVYWGMDLYSLRIPLGKPLNRGFASVRGTIIRNPEDSPCRPIRLLLHNQVHQLMVGLYSRCFLADPEELGSVDIPGGKIGPGAHSVVFELNTSWLMRHRTGADGLSVTGLDAGLFVGADHVVIWPQRESVEQSEIQVQDTSRLFSEEGVPREKPTPMHPRLDGITVEITPNGLDAYGNHDTSKHCLAGDIGVTETRKGEPQFDGKFAGESLDFHNGLRGKKSAVARALVDHPGHPPVRSRTVSATS